jgi:glycosyltransferase involved in cell wall biosynthesis
MKIFFDARYIRTDFHDGISRYTTELGNALSALTPVTFIVHDPAQLRFLPPDAAHIMFHPPTSVKEPFSARLLNRFRPDVVFSPLQTFGGSGRRFKLILTTHDMIYYHHRTPPRQFNPVLRLGWRLYHFTYGPQRLSLNSADLVATVSHTTQRELEAARLTKRPIVVIPNAPQDLKQYVAQVTTSAPRNLIYMGSFMPYKNVETLVRGMEWLPDHTLHLLSKITPRRQKELLALAPDGAKIVFHNGVSDETYAQLLADRGVLVSASLYEGYGLPVAEGLALGVPAVISNLPIFHEVAAGGAQYFDPTNPRAFADAVGTLNDQVVREQLVAAGTAHIRTFSWQASAQALLNAINSLV